jgi:hypothetical protein
MTIRILKKTNLKPKNYFKVLNYNKRNVKNKFNALLVD